MPTSKQFAQLWVSHSLAASWALLFYQALIRRPNP